MHRRQWGVLPFALVALLLLSAVGNLFAQRKKRVKSNERVYLLHSDELKFDQFGPNPGAQIVKGHVSFLHQGARLTCDSAYFYQESNSVKAFGNVRFRQGDTLSLDCDHAVYDGESQMMEARKNVVLKHRRQTLYTDSLNYDRLYNYAYFFEGGRLVDGKDKLTSDWGEYSTGTREAKFYFNVELMSGKDRIFTDTLHYDTRTSIAHLLGPSRMVEGQNTVNTTDGFYNTKTDKAQLYGRSTVVNGKKELTADTLYYSKGGESQGYGNAVYVDKENKNSLNCDYMQYNEQTGYGMATKRVLLKDYSQKDTLYVHADTLKLFTFNINTDSVYRVGHGYPHVRAYRQDIQAICDSMTFTSLDSCMTMYKDPIVWNQGRQLLGEVIKVYMNDSTVREANVIGQALSIEQMTDTTRYNQISSKLMNAYFTDGNLRQTEAIGNVKSLYFVVDDKDSSLIGLNNLTTDTLRMFLSPERKLQKVRTTKFESVLYPITQIPTGQDKLEEFAWFDALRPVDKDDIFVWRGKSEGSKLKDIKRQAPPLQTFGNKEGGAR